MVHISRPSFVFIIVVELISTYFRIFFCYLLFGVGIYYETSNVTLIFVQWRLHCLKKQLHYLVINLACLVAILWIKLV